ncbi:transposase [Acetobacter indonesiensis]|nr:transposase [Acetobacter indonesiensis]
MLDEVDPEVFIADKAYDTAPLIEKFEERGAHWLFRQRKTVSAHEQPVFQFIKNETSSNASSPD